MAIVQLNTSYKQILAIALPLMIGSAAQNIIVLSDNVFLYHNNKLDFAAVGLVGVFYLIVTSIGFGFSRGGQILIARKYGERDYRSVGAYFNTMVFFEFIMALVIFLFLQYGSDWFFSWFIDSRILHDKCLEYIYPRSYGVFFGYVGFSMIALYSGIARTKILIYDTIVLVLTNVFLNYILIFGKFGFEPMGIRGAAWASTISEIVAFIVFAGYMLYDPQIKKMKINTFDHLDIHLFIKTFKISSPIVWQSFVGLGSWFIFFSLIENMGTRPLEISNLMRNVYLILSIPCWGYSAAINTLVSGFIGNRKRFAVIPMIKKTAWMSLSSTLAFAIPVMLFPQYSLYPLFGSEDMSLIVESIPYFPILILILILFSIGSIFINGLTGTGHTITALWIQSLFSGIYILYTAYVIKVLSYNLYWVWGAEVLYWVGVLSLTLWYLYSYKWFEKKI